MNGQIAPLFGASIFAEFWQKLWDKEFKSAMGMPVGIYKKQTWQFDSVYEEILAGLETSVSAYFKIAIIRGVRSSLNPSMVKRSYFYRKINID